MLEDLSQWNVTGFTCQLGLDGDESVVDIQLRSKVDGSRKRLLLHQPASDSLRQLFPILNASLAVLSTADRGWDPSRRIELTDTDDAGPYLYSASYTLE